VIPGDHWSPNQKPPDFQKGVRWFTMNFTHQSGPWDSTFDIFHDIFHGDSTYPLVNIQKAMENGHGNSGFSH